MIRKQLLLRFKSINVSVVWKEIPIVFYSIPRFQECQKFKIFIDGRLKLWALCACGFLWTLTGAWKRKWIFSGHANSENSDYTTESCNLILGLPVFRLVKFLIFCDIQSAQRRLIWLQGSSHISKKITITIKYLCNKKLTFFALGKYFSNGQWTFMIYLLFLIVFRNWDCQISLGSS